MNNKIQKQLPLILSIAAILAIGIQSYFIWKLSVNETNTTVKQDLTQQQNQKPQQLYTQVKDVEPISDRDHVRGDRNARILLIEYSDFECPYCSRFHETAKKLVEDYDGKLAWSYRHYPLPSHSNADELALGSECAFELGGDKAFWAFADTYFTSFPYSVLNMNTLAKENGLNTTTFSNCVSERKHEDYIKAQAQEGAKVGVNATPGNIIWDTKTNEQRLYLGAFPYETLKAEIDKMLAE